MLLSLPEMLLTTQRLVLLSGRRSDNGDASQLAATLREVGDLRTDQSKARLCAKELLGLSKCLYVIEC